LNFLAGFNGFRLSSNRNCRFKLDAIKGRTSGATYDNISQSSVTANSYLEAADQVQGDYERFYLSETAKNVLFYRNAVFGGLSTLALKVSYIAWIVVETLCVTNQLGEDPTGVYEYGPEAGTMATEGINAACNIWNKVTGGTKGSARFYAGKGLKGLVW
jgi:TM2 domain-containing membrane protein YozV